MKFKFRVPDTLTIIFALVAIMGILTYVIPAGQFDREERNGKQVVVANTYKSVKSQPQSIMSILKAPVKGLMEATEIVSFVLIVGGILAVVTKSGAMGSGVNALIRIIGTNYGLLIALMMLIFGIGGTTTGTWEETIPFYIILTPVMLRMGLDPLVAVAVIAVGAGTGTIASTINPFATGIASKLAEIDISDGFYFRAVLFVLCMFLSIGWTIFYAYRVKLDKKNSFVADKFPLYEETFLGKDSEISEKFTFGHKLILLTLASGIGLMVVGVLHWDWYIQEMAGVYVAIGLLSWIFGRMKEEDVMGSFAEGVKDVATAALVIGLARGIVVIAENGVIIDTILSAITSALSGVHNIVFVNAMILVQSAIAFLVPSSSGHAALTIPIMVGIADIFEVPRHLVVTVFQIGSGMTNLITPTAGVLIGALSIAKVPWVRWVKFITPLLGMILILSMILISLQFSLS